MQHDYVHEASRRHGNKEQRLQIEWPTSEIVAVITGATPWTVGIHTASLRYLLLAFHSLFNISTRIRLPPTTPRLVLDLSGLLHSDDQGPRGECAQVWGKLPDKGSMSAGDAPYVTEDIGSVVSIHHTAELFTCPS